MRACFHLSARIECARDQHAEQNHAPAQPERGIVVVVVVRFGRRSSSFVNGRDVTERAYSLAVRTHTHIQRARTQNTHARTTTLDQNCLCFFVMMTIA